MGDFDACRFDFRIDARNGLMPAKRKRSERKQTNYNTLFKCKVCGHLFDSRPSLLEHKLVHVEHKCHVCQKRFTKRLQLRDHLCKAHQMSSEDPPTSKVSQRNISSSEIKAVLRKSVSNKQARLRMEKVAAEQAAARRQPVAKDGAIELKSQSDILNEPVTQKTDVSSTSCDEYLTSKLFYMSLPQFLAQNSSSLSTIAASYPGALFPSVVPFEHQQQVLSVTSQDFQLPTSMFAFVGGNASNLEDVSTSVAQPVQSVNIATSSTKQSLTEFESANSVNKRPANEIQNIPLKTNTLYSKCNIVMESSAKLMNKDNDKKHSEESEKNSDHLSPEISSATLTVSLVSKPISKKALSDQVNEEVLDLSINSVKQYANENNFKTSCQNNSLGNRFEKSTNSFPKNSKKLKRGLNKTVEKLWESKIEQLCCRKERDEIQAADFPVKDCKSETVEDLKLLIVRDDEKTATNRSCSESANALFQRHIDTRDRQIDISATSGQAAMDNKDNTPHNTTTSNPVVTDVTGLSSLKILFCPICKMTFERFADLQRHIATHDSSVNGFIELGLSDEQRELLRNYLSVLLRMRQESLSMPQTNSGMAPASDKFRGVPGLKAGESHFGPDTSDMGEISTSTGDYRNVAKNLLRKFISIAPKPSTMLPQDEEFKCDSLLKERIDEDSQMLPDDDICQIENSEEAQLTLRKVIPAPGSNPQFYTSLMKMKYRRRLSKVNPEDRSTGLGRENANTKKQYSCILCGECFDSVELMWNHKLKNHEDLTSFYCDTCGFDSDSLSELQSHMLATHGKEIGDFKNYICFICGKGYSSKMGLNHHLLRHGEDGPQHLICPYESCRLRFYNRPTLQRHLKRAHADSVVSNSLSPSTHPEKNEFVMVDQRPLVCDFPGCEKAFRESKHLKVHQMQHTDEKPLKCDLCAYCCRQRNSMNWHMKSKHGLEKHVTQDGRTIYT